MASKSSALDYWQQFFRGANSDIFEVIEHAIVVAATDYPKEFRLQRDRIAEKLFSCLLTRCSGCDRVELALPSDEDEDGFRGVDGRIDQKEGKMNSKANDPGIVTQVINYSFDEAEALTVEIEEANQVVGEVLRIKDVLANQQHEAGVLFESLRRLQLMQLSVEVLNITKIGMVVKGLTKHVSKQIRHLARVLIIGWKAMANQWLNSTAAIAGSSSDSVNPSSAVEEEGLPSPPLDEGAFLTTQTTGMELAQFFDGMDDDGNPHNSGEFDKNQGNRRNCLSENHIPKTKQWSPAEEPVPNKDKNQVRKPEAVFKQIRPSSLESGPGRPPKTALEQRVNGRSELQKRTDLAGVQKKQSLTVQDKSKNFDELSVQMKLEAAKRKLHEGYQQAENAKKQRTIQVMELHNLPKQGLGHRNQHIKPGTHNRNWANSRC